MRTLDVLTKAVFRFHFLFFYRAGTSLDRNLMSTHHVEMCFFLAPAWGSFNLHASNASSVPPTCQQRVAGQTHRRSSPPQPFRELLTLLTKATLNDASSKLSHAWKSQLLPRSLVVSAPNGKISSTPAAISLSSPKGEVATVT